MAFDPERLAQSIIRHELAARDLSAGEADKIVRLLNATNAEIAEKLAGRYAVAQAKGVDRGPATTRRLEEMMEGFEALNASVYKKIGERVEGQLIDRARHEMTFTRDAMKSAGATVRTGTHLPDTNYLRQLVRNTPIPVDEHTSSLLQPWLKGMEEGNLRRLGDTLRTSFAMGATPAELAKTLEERAFAKSRQSAQSLALTANSAVANQARLETFRAQGNITHVEWSSILDTRTTPVCQDLSGQIFPIDQPHPTPPRHIRCRSLLLPRKNDTDPPLHKTYRQWLSEQSPEVQDEALNSKKRGDDYRAGKLKDSELSAPSERFRTLDELRARDARITAPTAPPKPFSPINPAITQGSIPIKPRAEIKRQLSAEVATAAQDSRYIAKSITRGIKDTDLGKMTLPADLTDEAASLVLGLKSEVDAICDAFAVPRIRGIRTVPSSRSHVMNMGEGTLGINANLVNGYTGKVETKAADELAKVTARLDKLADKLKAGREEFDESDAVGFLEKYAGDYREYRDLASTQNKLKQKVGRTEKIANKSLVEWKPGDNPEKRPWTIDQYFEDPIDRMRALLYHETGHLVHDYFNNSGGYLGRTAEGKLVRKNPPVIRELEKRFAKFGRATPKEYDPRTSKSHFPSKYATTQPVEWWAENFSLYMMGRFELMEPELKELIEEMLKYAKSK